MPVDKMELNAVRIHDYIDQSRVNACIDICEYTKFNPIPDELLNYIELNTHNAVDYILSLFINELLPMESIVEYDTRKILQYGIYLSNIKAIDYFVNSVVYNGFRFNKHIYTFLDGKNQYLLDIKSGVMKYHQSIFFRIKTPEHAFSASHASKVWNDINKVKTQKARGIFTYGHVSRSGELYLDPLFSAKYSKMISKSFLLPYDDDISRLDYPIFARPCPLRPRHGFVESKPVNSLHDLSNLFIRTKEVDPNGEMLICPVLTGKYSFVMTPTVFTIGCGSNGATSGIGIDIQYQEQPILSTEFKDDIGITDTPYIEGVHDNTMGLQIVQIRNGPKVCAFSDYIPHTTTIKSVIIPEYHSLLEYAQLVEKAEQGTVVYAKGHGMASHYAAHAIAHQIPFISTFEPIIGTKIQAVESPLQDGQWNRIAEYLKDMQSQSIYQLLNLDKFNIGTQLKTTCTVAILAGHLTLLWPKNDKRLNYLTAWSIVAFIALYTMSLLGEIRHMYHYFKDKDYSKDHFICTSDETLHKLKHEFHKGIPREACYRAYVGRSMKSIIRNLPMLSTDFLLPFWESGIAGPNWAHATYSMQLLYDSYVNFLANPCEQNWSTLVAYWHTCIDEQHNNGYILNKFIDHGVFVNAAFSPYKILLNEDVSTFIANHTLLEVL